MEALGNALTKEIERCQELLVTYAAMGPSRAFCALTLKQLIDVTLKAMMADDVVVMVRAYEALRACE